jgi:hypothetical protein
MYIVVTHFHVDIGCNVNLIDSTTIAKMSHDIPFDVTHFRSKYTKSIFLIIYRFKSSKSIMKNINFKAS